MDYLFCEWGGVDGSIQPQEKAVLELPRSATRYFKRVCVTQPLYTGLHQPAARESPSAACCNSSCVACRNSPCLAVSLFCTNLTVWANFVHDPQSYRPRPSHAGATVTNRPHLTTTLPPQTVLSLTAGQTGDSDGPVLPSPLVTMAAGVAAPTPSSMMMMTATCRTRLPTTPWRPQRRHRGGSPLRQPGHSRGGGRPRRKKIGVLSAPPPAVGSSGRGEEGTTARTSKGNGQSRQSRWSVRATTQSPRGTCRQPACMHAVMPL